MPVWASEAPLYWTAAHIYKGRLTKFGTYTPAYDSPDIKKSFPWNCGWSANHLRKERESRCTTKLWAASIRRVYGLLMPCLQNKGAFQAWPHDCCLCFKASANTLLLGVAEVNQNITQSLAWTPSCAAVVERVKPILKEISIYLGWTRQSSLESHYTHGSERSSPVTCTNCLCCLRTCAAWSLHLKLQCHHL
jgi:hypothetical protein